MTWKDHLQRAISLSGSQAKLADEMSRCGDRKYRQSHISWWINSADKIDAEDALAVHRATKGEVTASQLRPDLWPTNEHVPAAPTEPVEASL